jgi:hypothetical protein
LFLLKIKGIVKSLTAIFFSLLLVLGQFAPAAAACAKPAMNCSDACRQMPCCAARPASGSQPAPAVPAQSGAQNQISLLAPATVAWILPQSPVSLVTSVSASPLVVMAAPLYARNCTLLL